MGEEGEEEGNNLSDNLTMSKSINLYIKYKQTCWRVRKVKLQVQKQTQSKLKSEIILNSKKNKELYQKGNVI